MKYHKISKKRKKNPFVGTPSKTLPRVAFVKDVILKNVPNIFIKSSDTSDVYYINLKTSVIFRSQKIDKGEYIFKYFIDNNKLSLTSRNYMITLSEKKLIPKIFYIDQDIIIMKYIEAVSLQELLEKQLLPKNIEDRRKIFRAVEEEVTRWHNLGYAHANLYLKNILLTRKFEIYLIDPKNRPPDDYPKLLMDKAKDYKQLEIVEKRLEKLN